MMSNLCMQFPVDTGRKLNVLCTFNLRPVPTRLYSEYRKIMRDNAVKSGTTKNLVNAMRLLSFLTHTLFFCLFDCFFVFVFCFLFLQLL